MKKLLPWLLLASVLPMYGNEALDVLEGKKEASEVELPPAPEGSIALINRDSLAYMQPQWAPSPLDPLWARAMVFEDPTHPWLQQVAITGDFGWHAAFGRAEITAPGGGSAGTVDLDSTRTRRARLGARLRMFHNTEVEAVSELAGGNEFRGIESLSAETDLPGQMKVKYGKFRPQFPLEYDDQEMSAYPNRTMLANMISPRSSLGVMLSKSAPGWEYGLGWFSSDRDRDFPNIDGDGFLVFNATRTLIEPAGLTNRHMRWNLNYIHNFDANKGGAMPSYDLAGQFSANGGQAVTQNPAYRHLVATGIQLDQDQFSMASDVMFAMGENRAWGLSLSPSYWLMPGTLKLVARYHYAESSDAGGLVSTMGVSNDPLFDSSPFFIGDEFESIYLGANLHLYQDQMVLMGGVEQINLKDQAGAGYDVEAAIWHLGARLSF